MKGGAGGLVLVFVSSDLVSLKKNSHSKYIVIFLSLSTKETLSWEGHGEGVQCGTLAIRMPPLHQK